MRVSAVRWAGSVPAMRRSMLYVPGSSPKMLKKSSETSADAICFDLEDSVAEEQKDRARVNVLNALNASEKGRHELLVRVNGRATGLTSDDLKLVMSSPNIDGIVLPKVHNPQDIHWAEDLIKVSATSAAAKKDVRIIASIESARAVVALKEIASASPRIDTLLFAAEDFCADTGIQRSADRSELLYARSAVVTTARAFDLASMDLVTIELDDPAVLTEECADGRRLGFTSKQAIHPKQVEQIHRAFSPSAADIERAVSVLENNARHTASGAGAFGYTEKEGRGRTMIDAPMILQATTIVRRAQSLNMDVPWSDNKPLAGF